MRFLIVVDMQNDFITGALGSPDAEAILPTVLKKVKEFDGEIIFTKDTHSDAYLSTAEGRKLPVVHCIKGTGGWEIEKSLLPYASRVVEKLTFGSTDLPDVIKKLGDAEYIELCGLCTDICVISNAMILKAAFPEATVVVDSSASAGVSRESHNTALAAMRAVQIEIV